MLTNKALNFAEALAMILDSREDSEFAWNYTNKLAEEIRNTNPKVKVANGMYRYAIVFPTFVIKFARDERVEELVAEAKFINKMRKHKVYGRHFPETHIVEVGDTVVLIQEKVNMSHKGKSWELRNAVDALADHLGLEDMHEGNYGWKGPKGREYPVFVDVDFRCNKRIMKPKARRSWMV